jgi:hypothetical protein
MLPAPASTISACTARAALAAIVIAADSVLRVVHWVPVGDVPRVDTVNLSLRRP